MKAWQVRYNLYIHAQEAFWKQWLRQAEGLVLLPEAEGSQGAQTDAWTARDSAVAHKACRLERSIHSNVVRQQHMFTVSQAMSQNSQELSGLQWCHMQPAAQAVIREQQNPHARRVRLPVAC